MKLSIKVVYNTYVFWGWLVKQFMNENRVDWVKFYKESVNVAFKVDQHSVLNGLNHEDSAVKWNIYILRVKKKMTKKIYVDVFIFLLLHIYSSKAPITANLENVPDSRFSAYGRKYYHLFKYNISSAHI